MLFAEKAFTVDGTVHTPVVNQKIQGAGEEPLGQFCGGGLHQIQVHLGILFIKAGDQRRQHIGCKKVGTANGKGSAF